jgi:hypothetical protein
VNSPDLKDLIARFSQFSVSAFVTNTAYSQAGRVQGIALLNQAERRGLGIRGAGLDLFSIESGEVELASRGFQAQTLDQLKPHLAGAQDQAGIQGLEVYGVDPLLALVLDRHGVDGLAIGRKSPTLGKEGRAEVIVGSQKLDLTFRVFEVKPAVGNRVGLGDLDQLTLAVKPFDLACHQLIALVKGIAILLGKDDIGLW